MTKVYLIGEQQMLELNAASPDEVVPNPTPFLESATGDQYCSALELEVGEGVNLAEFSKAFAEDGLMMATQQEGQWQFFDGGEEKHVVENQRLDGTTSARVSDLETGVTEQVFTDYSSKAGCSM